MRLPADLLTTLNDEYTLERYSNGVYMALAAQFEKLSLTGFAEWARRAADDEATHARKFFDYLTDRNETPVVDQLDPAPTLRPDPLALFQAALEQERTVSDALRAIYAQAEELSDPPTCEFLLWFLKEQVESERDLTTITGKLSAAAGDYGAVLFLDHELGEGEK